MNNNLAVLPIWKKDGDIADRLFEMAAYARAKPEKFERFAMAYIEKLENGNLKIRTMSHNCDLPQLIGLLELGKLECYKDSEQ